MPESYLQRQNRLEAAKSQLRDTYRTHLGRDGDDDEILSHLGGGRQFEDSNVYYAMQNIANSEEARNRRNAPAPQDGDTQQASAQGSPEVRTAAAPPPSGPPHLATASSARMASAPAPPPMAPMDWGRGKVAVDPTSVYTRGTLGAATAGTPISQYQGPNTAPVDNATEAHILALLANPFSLGDETVSAMKSKGRDAAVSMAEQLKGANALDTAGRGFSALGGVRAAGDRAVEASMIDSIINSNREVDLTKAATDRSDLLDALGASEAFNSGRVGRSTAQYGAKLSGETAREGARQFDNTNLLQRFLAEEGTKQAEDASRFRNDDFRYGQMSDDREQSLAEWLARETAGQNRTKTALAADQFGLTFDENKRQFNNNTAFNYSQLNAQQQSDLMDSVCRIIKC